MKELKRYMCEYCETVYKDKNEAEKCEHSHMKPERIVYADYLKNGKFSDNYPLYINIKMSDGAILAYTRENRKETHITE